MPISLKLKKDSIYHLTEQIYSSAEALANISFNKIIDNMVILVSLTPYKQGLLNRLSLN